MVTIDTKNNLKNIYDLIGFGAHNVEDHFVVSFNPVDFSIISSQSTLSK